MSSRLGPLAMLATCSSVAVMLEMLRNILRVLLGPASSSRPSEDTCSGSSWGKAPLGKIAAPALAETPEPHLCILLYLPGQVLKVASGITALVLLESRDSCLHQ